MKSKTKISASGISFIKRWEGNHLTAYKCPAQIWTIGVGHTGKVGLKSICEGMKITDKQSTALLLKDIKGFEAAVNTYVNVPLTQNQFDALVSFAFNEGSGNLKKSTLLKKLNKGDYLTASFEFLKWDKADTDGDGDLEALRGLANRRKAEQALFLAKI